MGFGNSNTQTLAAISNISVHLERATFFLALTSVAGSINKLCVDNACAFHGSRSLPFYDVLVICLYITCVIFTILAAPVDEIMHHSSLRVPDWRVHCFINNLTIMQLDRDHSICVDQVQVLVAAPTRVPCRL
jgi:hypothetical protein